MGDRKPDRPWDGLAVFAGLGVDRIGAVLRPAQPAGRFVCPRCGFALVPCDRCGQPAMCGDVLCGACQPDG